MTFTTIVIAIIAVIGIAILIYNRIVTAQTKVREGWSGITVQLKRRHDLVPNLISAVSSAMEHERGIVDQVTEARKEAIAAVQSGTTAEVTGAEAALSASLRALIAYSEAYPEVKATGNVAEFQRQLEETEDQIAASRRLYNGNVQRYNALIRSIPANLIAGPAGFGPEQSFELDPGEQAAVEQVPVVALRSK